jgi:hypothetical protein
MTDSKMNVRRSIGPRRTGEGESPAGTDPLAELTRFMDRDPDDAGWPSRRVDAARGGEATPDDTGDAPARRPIRRQPPAMPSFDDGVSEQASAEDAMAPALDADAPNAGDAPGEGDDDARAPEFEDEFEDDRLAATENDADISDVVGDEDDADDELIEAHADEGEPEDEPEAEDPFMQALMQELESDMAPQQDAAPAPRVRPSFAFPAARAATDASPAPSTTSEAHTAPTDAPDAGPHSGPPAAETPAPPVSRRSPPPPPVRSRATPVAPPPVQATVPMPPARDADAERLEHARDHAAISSEADGALEQLRSRLARGHQAGAATADAPKPVSPRPATSWSRPVQPSVPGRPETTPAPVAAPPAQGAIERPSFVRQQPVAAPVATPGVQEPAEERFRTETSDDIEIDEEGTVELEFHDLAHEAEPEDAPTSEGDDAPDAGWTLDEDELASAIALSVGGAEHGDDETPSDEMYDADEDGDLFHDADVTGHEGDDASDTSAIDEIDFEFELMTTAPDATADDFRKPSERSEPTEPLEPLEIGAFESPEQALDMDEFTQALALPEEADDDVADASEEADVVEDDSPSAVEDADEKVPPRVFPELASRGRRAVPSFRFDLQGSDHAAQADALVPAKPRDRDLDFDLPGFGSPDPWGAWPAGPKQAAKTGPAATMTDGSPTVAEQLAEALFDEKPAPAELPRVLGNRPAFTGSDWPARTAAADAEAADDLSGDYEEADETYGEYDEAYYDEAEPEWEDDEHALPPHSLGEMDAALGLSDRPRRKLGRPVAAAVLLLLVVGGGYAAYSVLTGTEEAADGPPPVIQADADGVKVMADGADQTDGSKTVYDRVGEDGAESGRLVRSQEVPIDPSQNAAAESPISSPLLPKRVRTVVVRPDGTIIPADELDAAQGQTEALVAPSTADTVSGEPASDVATSPTPIADTAPETAAEAEPAAAGEAETALPGVDIAAETDAASDTPPAAEAPSAPVLSPIRTSERIAAEPSPAPAPRPAASEDTRTVATSRVTAPPAAQPRGPLSLVPDAPGADTAATTTATRTLPSPSRSTTQETVGDRVSPAVLAAQNQRANQPQGTQTAAAPPAATPAPAASAPTGDWAVQVSSQRTADQARAAYQQLQRKFPGVLGGREPAIQSADLGSKGTFYRVRLPTQTRDAANQLCSELKAAGGDCFVGRN